VNEYSVGALEALSYVLTVLDKHFPSDSEENKNGPIVDAYEEIEVVQLRIIKGTADLFKHHFEIQE